jgi:truncated hemoglobin YjbI
VTVTIPSLYERLGGDGGIAAAVASHTTAMLGSGKVNAWLRNNSVDLARMNECTASWIGAQAGGPSYDPTCRPLLEAHAGKGLATRDFTAWTDLLATVLTARGTAQRDIDELVALIAPTSQDVVEDPDGAATLFQRLGGRPGVWAIIEDFSTKLIWNPEIAGFFTGPDGAPVYSLRTATCLLRLVGSVDGPFRYGEELGREPNVTGTACRDMVTAHTNMTAPPQQADGKKVGAREFSEVARMLMCTMADHDVSQADIDLTLSVLAPMCGDITAPGTDCGEVFVEPVCP